MGEPAVNELRRALAERAEHGSRAPVCPPLEEFWDAQSGAVSAARTRDLIEHTTTCPACAEAWRLAHALGAMEQENPARRPSSGRWQVGLAAAAVVVLAIGVATQIPTERKRDPDAGYRSGQTLEIQSLVPESQPLPRDDFVLRWSPGPDGAVYAFTLTTESFEPVDAAEGLADPERRVDTERLAGLESGKRLLWRAEALLPDGRKVQSDTFFVLLE
jgi:hypothetical protein